MPFRLDWLLAVSLAIGLASQSRQARAEITLSPIASNGTYSTRTTQGAGLYDSTVNKTWVAWNGRDMDIYVREYNHSTGTWGSAVKAADVDQNHKNAYHDYPMMTLAPDGRLIIFFADHTNALYQVKARVARSVTGGWDTKEIPHEDRTEPGGYPYVQVVGGKIYVFPIREPRQKPYRPLNYMVSADSGENWSDPSPIIDTGRADSQHFDEVYLLSTHADGDKIHMVWHMAGGKDGPEGHNFNAKDLYYATFRTADQRMYNAAGKNLGRTIQHNQLADCLVRAYQPVDDPATKDEFDNTHPVNQAVVLTDSLGPVVAYQLNEYNLTTRVFSTSVQFARWTGSAWSLTEVIRGNPRFYDMKHMGGSAYRLAYPNADYTHVLVKSTTDGGKTWVDSAAAPVPFAGVGICKVECEPNDCSCVPCAGEDRANVGVFVENGTSTVEMILQTYNAANKKKDYCGRWSILAMSTVTAGMTVFHETFNGAAPGSLPAGWEVTLSSGTDLQIASVQGDNAMKFTDTSPTGSAMATRRFAKERDVSVLGWGFMQPTFALAQKMFVQSGNTVVVELYAGDTADGSKDIWYLDAAGNRIKVMSYVENRFYWLQVSVNVVMDTFDLMIDNVVKAQNVPLRNPVSSVDNIHFRTGTSAGTSSYTQYVDGVYLWH